MNHEKTGKLTWQAYQRRCLKKVLHDAA